MDCIDRVIKFFVTPILEIKQNMNHSNNNQNQLTHRRSQHVSPFQSQSPLLGQARSMSQVTQSNSSHQLYSHSNNYQMPPKQNSGSHDNLNFDRNDNGPRNRVKDSAEATTGTDKPEAQKTIAKQATKKWYNFWDSRVFGHWSYMNNITLACFLLLCLNIYLFLTLRDLQRDVEDLAVSNSCRTTDISQDVAFEINQLKISINEFLIDQNEAIATVFKNEVSKLSKSASKRATVINEDLGYLGTRVSNLQSAVRNLARSAKDSTIVPTRCRNERENFEDEPAYF